MKTLLAEIETPLKNELRKLRAAGSTREFLESDIRGLIIRVGVSGYGHAARTRSLVERDCVNLCIKEFRKIGWDFGFRVIEPYVRLAQPIETKICIGCGGWI